MPPTSSFTTENSADTGRNAANAQESYPRASTSKNTGEMIMEVSPRDLRDRRQQPVNGVQAYHTLTPGPTKQPYYPAIRFVEQSKGLPSPQTQQPRTQPSATVPTKKSSVNAASKQPEANSSSRVPPKARIDTSVAISRQFSSTPRPQEQRPNNSTVLSYQYEAHPPHLRPSSRTNSPLPERRHTIDTATSRPPLPPPSRRHSDQTALQQMPTKTISPQPAATPIDAKEPFPRVVSRTGTLTPPHIRQAASQAIAPVQALFEQAWNTNVHMVHQQLTRIHQEADARHRIEIAAVDAHNARLRRERDEARNYANTVSMQTETLKSDLRSALSVIGKLEQEIARLRYPPQSEIKPNVKREREDPPTLQSNHPEPESARKYPPQLDTKSSAQREPPTPQSDAESRRQVQGNEHQSMRTIRLSPPGSDLHGQSKTAYISSPFTHPSSSPFMRPKSSPMSQPSDSPPIRHPQPPARRRLPERSTVPLGMPRQDSNSSRRMDLDSIPPSTMRSESPSLRPRSPPRAPANERPSSSRSESASDQRLPPASTSFGSQPRLQPQVQQSLPHFATLDLPAINTQSEAARPFKRSRTAYEGEEQSEGVSRLSSPSKVTKTTHQDTPGASSREQSVRLSKPGPATPMTLRATPLPMIQAPSQTPTSVPPAAMDGRDEEEVGGTDSDKEQRPPPPPKTTQPHSAPLASAPSPRPEPPARQQPRPTTPREREPFRTSSVSNSMSPPEIGVPPLSEPTPVSAKAEAAAPPPPKKGLGIKHMQLLYETRGQELLCKICVAVVPRITPARFPQTAPWAELLKHWEEQHPGECQDLERLGTGSLAELSVRQQKKTPGMAGASASANGSAAPKSR